LYRASPNRNVIPMWTIVCTMTGRVLLERRVVHIEDALADPDYASQAALQPRVLDRDHRLVGEGADQLDLPLGERLDPLHPAHA
jgi:hypothetical protein